MKVINLFFKIKYLKETLMPSKKLTTLSIAVASIIASPAILAETTVYGKAHLSAASLDDDNGSSTAISSHSSRFGAKGSYEKEGNMEVFFKVEWQVDMSDQSGTSATTTLSGAPVDSASTKTSDHIKSRSQYAGIKAGWGEIRLGRDDSPYKKAGKKGVEFFSDTYADYNNIVDKGQDTRANSSISYSNKIGPGKLSLMYATGDDSTAGENAGDATSISYDATFGAVRVALATQSINDSGVAGNTETGTKLVVGYKMSKTAQLGVLFETVTDDNDTVDDTNTVISYKQKMGKNALKFAYGMKDQGLANDATMTALAYDHKLNKSTTAYAIYAAGADDGLNANSKLAGDSTVIGGGLVVKF